MNIYIWLIFISGLFNLAMVLILAPYRKRSGAITWFQVSSIGSAVLSIGIVLVGCSKNPIIYESAYMAIQLFVLVPPTLIIFVLYLINKEELLSGFWFNILLWLPPIVLLMLLLGTDIITVNGFSHAIDSGFGYMTYPNGPLGNIKAAYIGIGFLIPPIILAVHLKKMKRSLKRKEIGMILLGMTPPVLGGMVFEGILPTLGYKTLPIGAIFVTFTDIIIVYAILKYGLNIFNVRSAISTIVGAMPNGLIVLDHTYFIQYVNPGTSSLLGYSEGELFNAPVEKLFTSEREFKEFKQQVASIDEHKGFVIPDTKLVHKNNETVPVSINLANIWEKGQPVNIIMVVSDISKLKIAEKQLEQEKTRVEQLVEERTRQLNEAQAQLSTSVGALPFGFALINLEGEIIFSNTALSKLIDHSIPYNQSETKTVLQEIAAIYKPSIDILADIEKTRVDLQIIEDIIEYKSIFLRFLFVPVVVNNRAIGTVILLENKTA